MIELQRNSLRPQDVVLGIAAKNRRRLLDKPTKAGYAGLFPKVLERVVCLYIGLKVTKVLVCIPGVAGTPHVR